MCAYEEYIFTCGHARYGLVCYCHRARNHPTRRCDFVKTLDKIWHQGRLCDPCQAAWAACHQSQGQGQGPLETTNAHPNNNLAGHHHNRGRTAEQLRQGDHHDYGRDVATTTAGLLP